MARRTKSSLIEDLVSMVALLPWWVGVAIALAGHWLLHDIATRPLSEAEVTHQGSLITSAIWQGLAATGQYVWPIIFLAGAGISAVRRWKRRSLFLSATSGTNDQAIQQMSWQEFELLVGEGFRRRGFVVKETSRNGADGGVDLILSKGGGRYFVQCKQWKALKVGVSVVRELYGVTVAHGAKGGIVVTSGTFTQEAVAFAWRSNIRLMDGSELRKLLRDVRHPSNRSVAPPPAREAPSASPDELLTRAPATATQTATTVPTVSSGPACPLCSKTMVRRIAKKGTGRGRTFWGCPGFTAGCHGTREIDDF